MPLPLHVRMMSARPGSRLSGRLAQLTPPPTSHGLVYTRAPVAYKTYFLNAIASPSSYPCQWVSE